MQLKTVIYADGKDVGAGYSHTEKSEIGLDILNGNSLVTGNDLENSYWHEVTHQADKTNTTTQDREKYATNMGNSAEITGTLNNWLYGDGGLNNYTILNYYLTNQNTLQLNNNYVNTLDKNLLDNKAYLAGRQLNNPTLAYLNFNHQFIIITGTEKELGNYIKEYNIANNLSLPVEPLKINQEMELKGIEKTAEDSHYIILGGYKGGNHTNANLNGSEQGHLVKDVSSPDDNDYLVKGNIYSIEIDFKIKDKDTNNRELIESYLGYDNSAKYPGTGVPNKDYYRNIIGIELRKPEALQTYNSNSFAYSLCSNAGGTNCNYDFKGRAPGSWKQIPDIYLNFNKKGEK